MPKIAIINYGMGNIRNVQRGIQKTGSTAPIVTEESELDNVDAIILPGVGAFRDAITNLSPFHEGIRDRVSSGVPLLGICLGLQLLFTQSTEGGTYQGLDILKGQIVRLPPGQKVPQMGWNTLQIVDENNPLIQGLTNNSYAYFVHSYYAKVMNKGDIVTITHYGIDIPSIVSHRNVFATQFHPEKSGKTGLTILNNFVNFVKK